MTLETKVKRGLFFPFREKEKKLVARILKSEPLILKFKAHIFGRMESGFAGMPIGYVKITSF